jgi:hypothetical protein
MKICRVCKKKFGQTTRTQKVCSLECAIAYPQHEQAKQARKENRKLKQEFKQNDKSYQLKKTQMIFNKWVRHRDGSVCITCEAKDRQIHAGHYMPVGRHSEVRFDPHNCHSQCSICNNFKSGNLAIYRQRLIEKYGLAEVERLEHSTTKKWTIDELVSLQKKFKK